MGVMEHKYDKLAGEPGHLQQMAQHYLDIANAIRDSVTALKAIGDDSQNQSQSTDALKKQANDLADDIDKAENRYRVTARALLDYVPHLSKGQSDSEHPAQQIAYWEKKAAETGQAYHQLQNPLPFNSSPFPGGSNPVPSTSNPFSPDYDKDKAKADLDAAKGDADHAAHQLAYWQGQWEDAAAIRNTAAGTAKDKIHDVVFNHNNGLKNPTHHWWSDAFHWVADHWDQIVKWAGVASLLLGWVPILGQILTAFTVLASIVQLVRDIKDGKGWKAITGDIVGLALSVVGGPAIKYLSKVGKLGAMTKVIKGGSPWNYSSGFTKTFGGSVIKGIVKPTEMEGVASKGLKSFGKELYTPYVPKSGSISGEFSKFVHSGGGLSIPKLSSATSFSGGMKVLGEMGTPTKIALVANDVRKVAGNAGTIWNTGDSFAHRDFGLKNDPPQKANLSEKGLINLL
jgi:hypothetical protein